MTVNKAPPKKTKPNLEECGYKRVVHQLKGAFFRQNVPLARFRKKKKKEKTDPCARTGREIKRSVIQTVSPEFR